MQRRRDRRPRGRFPHPHAIPPAAVNDRLGAGHVLQRALGRLQQRLLDPLPIAVVGHRPHHRHRLRHRQRHLHVRDPGHPLDHPAAILVDERLAVVVPPFALEHARPAQLIACPDVLPLERGDQIVALNRLTTPHAKLRERVVGAEPQRRRAPLRAALKTFLRELVVGPRERLRSGLKLEAVVTRPRRVDAIPDFDHDFRQRQHGTASSAVDELMARRLAGVPDGVRLVWCD
jgi:hypothetical protein